MLLTETSNKKLNDLQYINLIKLMGHKLLIQMQVVSSETCQKPAKAFDTSLKGTFNFFITSIFMMTNTIRSLDF